MTDLTLDEKLVLLVEECGEVIQAATKCLRFGYERNQPGYGVNKDVLAHEIGDLMGVVDALTLDWKKVSLSRREKMLKAALAKRNFAANRVHSETKNEEPPAAQR